MRCSDARGLRRWLPDARAWSAAGLLLLLAQAAHAQRSPDPYAVDLVRDVSVTLIAGAVWAVPPLFRDQLQRTSCPCNAADLNRLDRGTAGVHRTTPSVISDVAVPAAYALGFALDGLDVAIADAGLDSWAKDALVLAQVIAVNGAVNELAKVAFSRPRPLVYGLAPGDPGLTLGDNYTSFYSEHTSGTFAIGTAYAMTYALRHPRSPFRYAIGGAVVLVGGGVAALRVASGKHFPTDVITGALIGTAFGWLLPTLHEHVPEAQVGFLPLRGGAALSVAFPAW